MLSILKIENLKALLIVVLVVAGVWFFKDYQFQKAENKRQTENAKQLREKDSLKFAKQYYTKEELKNYLEYNRKDLQDFLRQQRVKLNRIQSIITQELSYKDSTKRRINLNPIKEAILKNQDKKIPVTDSTSCLIIKGYVVFKNDTLSLDITDRQFKNKSDVVSYWQRNLWKTPFGFKTRFLGRKTATVTIKDSCGNTDTFVINKKK